MDLQEHCHSNACFPLLSAKLTQVTKSAERSVDADRGLSVGMLTVETHVTWTYVFEQICFQVALCGVILCGYAGKTLLLIALVMEFRLQYWALKSNMLFRQDLLKNYLNNKCIKVQIKKMCVLIMYVCLNNSVNKHTEGLHADLQQSNYLHVYSDTHLHLLNGLHKPVVLLFIQFFFFLTKGSPCWYFTGKLKSFIQWQQK